MSSKFVHTYKHLYIYYKNCTKLKFINFYSFHYKHFTQVEIYRCKPKKKNIYIDFLFFLAEEKKREIQPLTFSYLASDGSRFGKSVRSPGKLPLSSLQGFKTEGKVSKYLHLKFSTNWSLKFCSIQGWGIVPGEMDNREQVTQSPWYFHPDLDIFTLTFIFSPWPWSFHPDFDLFTLIPYIIPYTIYPFITLTPYNWFSDPSPPSPGCPAFFFSC